MNNENFEQYIKKAKMMAMTPEEKAHILANLESMMEKKIPSPYLFYFQFTRPKVAILAVLLIFVLTAGTSFAASGTLPGDLLYPVKINVNEKVESYIAERNGTKVDFEAELAVNRLEEAEQLENEGRLDAATQETIENNFEEHAANVSSQIGISATASSSDRISEKSEKTAANFQAKLEAHRNILKQLSDVSNNNNKPILSSLILTVDSALRINSRNASTTNASSTATSTARFKGQSIRTLDEKFKSDQGTTTSINTSANLNATNVSPPGGISVSTGSNLNTGVNQGGGNVVNTVTNSTGVNVNTGLGH